MHLIYTHPWLLLSSLILLVTFAYNVAASSPVLEPVPGYPQYQAIGAAPSLPVTAFGIYDFESGKMLVSNNAEETLPIASITKLATASVLISKYDLAATASVVESDVLADGRSGNLRVGEDYTYRDLIFPLLLESSNDAAEFYSRVTDDSLVLEMNNLAEKLNLTKTNFADSSGLLDFNTSSVRDLQNLMRYIYQETPLVLDISRLRNYVGPHKVWTNNSPILHQDYRGGKHGYTEAANRTALAVFAEDFAVGERLLIYVILGSDNLAVDMDTLRNFVKTGVTFK